MRREQLLLDRAGIEHEHSAELEQISRVLEENPGIARRVQQDLERGLRRPGTGAPGLSGDQVVRMLIVKQMNGFSYEELEFHLADSVSYRRFCRLGALGPTPRRSTLAENLKKVSAKTLEKVNRRIVRAALKRGVEKGDKIRVDATVTKSNIHAPSDSALLFDGVRVLCRLLGRAREWVEVDYTDHTRRARRRWQGIQYAKSPQKRLQRYRDLLQVSEKSLRAAEEALSQLRPLAALRAPEFAPIPALREALQEMTLWVGAVIDQTKRRVLQGESVPASEKVVSIFEPHTDIIVKDQRETLYGHKLYLSAGASGLITDCWIADGNPADTTLAIPMLRRQKRILGKVPRQAAFDGGFASKPNLVNAKALGVQDVAFAKKRGLAISEMTRSSWVYRRLRDFRAGIEGLISFLKRAFGLDRCTWRGAESFGSYVQASILTANLLTVARHLLA
jgi:IS5 family transposase